VGNGLNLQFNKKEFDVVICNQIYEHVPNPFKLVAEIRRVLKDEGFCYFGAGNRFCIWEAHYHLYFLSMIPKPLANIYVRIARGEKEYYENLFSYFKLLKLLRTFDIYDYTYKVIRHPEKFSCTEEIHLKSIFKRLPLSIYKILLPVIPAYIWVLTKKKVQRKTKNYLIVV